MLLVSFLLVIVATIFLVSGLFLTKDLALIFISIGCSAVAGLVLVVAVLRSRPKPTDAAPIEAETGGDRRVSASGPATATAAGAAFPIENYDSLEVVDVLPLLGELSPGALEQVRAREAGGRAHPWVLARIDALLESEEETGEWETGDLGAEDAWAEPQPEWAETGEGSSEWTASDFELESSADGGYGELEIARDFPIADYHNLRATDILAMLSNLDEEDLKLVREVEAGGKARTSILSRIDALLARGIGLPGVSAPSKRAPAAAKPSRAALNLPLADYDSLTVAQITAQLAGLSAADLRTLRTYEKRHKARSGVIQKIEAALLRAQ